MSASEDDAGSGTRVTRTRAQKMAASSPEKVAQAETRPGKKESFQWSTPADEFADDVGSDIEDMGDETYSDMDDSLTDNSAAKGKTVIDKESGGIIISLGSEEASKYSVSEESTLSSPEKKTKKAKSKQQFPCPKCDKVWNWPWELRRHLVMHFKEVSSIKFAYMHFICFVHIY